MPAQQNRAWSSEQNEEVIVKHPCAYRSGRAGYDEAIAFYTQKLHFTLVEENLPARTG